MHFVDQRLLCSSDEQGQARRVEDDHDSNGNALNEMMQKENDRRAREYYG